MYAESVTVEIPDWVTNLQTLAAQLPAWAWVAIAAAVWYQAAGLVLKMNFERPKNAEECFSALAVWLFSPIWVIIPTLISAASFGLVPPPWKWKSNPPAGAGNS